MVESNLDPTFDDRFIDRLVDGEISAAELRAAIGRIDQSPDGWKRCALAFLEAQCWQQSLVGIGSRTDPSGEDLSFSANRGTPRHRRSWIRTAVAAAVMLLSFSLGWAGHAARHPAAKVLNRDAPHFAKHTLVLPDLPAESVDLRSHDQAANLDTNREERDDLAVATSAVRSVGHIRLGSESTGADVPILAGPGIDETWLRNQPPPLTEHGQVVLEQQGYQVDQQRQLISTTLADGRRVAIPVDQVQIRYVGNEPL